MLRVERFMIHPSRRATVVAQPRDGGLTQVAVWDVDAMLPRQNQPLPNIYCQSPTSLPCSTPPPFTTVLGPNYDANHRDHFALGLQLPHIFRLLPGLHIGKDTLDAYLGGHGTPRAFVVAR